MKSEILTDKEERLAYFNELYRTSLNERKIDFEKMRAQYEGDKSIDGACAKSAGIVRNITYELIESQVSSHIPIPNVTPKVASERMERNSRNVMNMLKNLRDELPFEKLNDMDERNTYVFGSSVFYIEWDYEFNRAEVTLLSPSQIVPEPNVSDVQKMNYVFLNYNDSVKNVENKFNVKLNRTELVDNEVQVVICFFKEGGKISQEIFTDDIELQYLPDYYAKRRKICKTCKKPVADCECGGEGFEFEIVQNERLTENYESEFVQIPMKSPKIVDGILQEERVYDESVGEYIMVPKLKPTVLPIYRPTLFPIVVRKNISKANEFFGQSDAVAIRHQQQEINKLETRIMEKLLKAGVIPYSAESTDLRLSDEIYSRGIKLKTVQEKNLLGVLDLQASISQDVEQSERLYQHAKRIIGISDSFQGMPDRSASSGIAKQMLINQSGGRLESKRVMKNSAYADLDKILFEFYLAFGIGKKPIYSVDANGNPNTEDFSKFDFLELSENGEWKFNDAYMFSTDLTSDLEKDRGQMWTEIRNNYQAGVFGDSNTIQSKLIFWKNMSKARYPFAKENIELLKEAYAEQRQEFENDQALALSQQAEMTQPKIQDVLPKDDEMKTQMFEELKNIISKGVTNGKK
ncbi:MAG: hypothetical protein RR327_02915 [Clostridia bacterium]